MENVNFIEWLLNIFNWIFEQFSYSADFVCNLLPDSPFRLLSFTPIEPYLSALNYFIPIDFMLSTLSAWCICITVYYTYKSILRWAKQVE